MTIVHHELRQSRLSLTIWTAAIGFLMAVCIFLFPEMKGEMDGISDLFSSMGDFSKAFGMDKISFGTLLGFYAVECGNVLGLGGAFFAALTAASALSKEEQGHTAEFLLTHPVSRSRIITQKLLAVVLQILILNAAVFCASLASVALIGASIPWREIGLLHLAYLLLQMELAAICFGISAFLRRGSLGIGLGVAVVMYFLSLVSNITESASFLRYITPFSYANGSEIATSATLDGKLLLPGLLFTAAGVLTAYGKYTKKDIA